MVKSDSTGSGFTGKPQKPAKPYPDFPLFPHATKRWAKKIRGKMHYFGPWDDPDGALKKYLAEKDDLHAGRKAREQEVSAGVTVKVLCNAFLNHKEDGLKAGDLSPRTWKNYKETAELLVKQFGKARLVSDLRPDDFAALRNAMSRTWGPVRVGNFVQQVRSVFKFGYDSELLAVPLRFGPGFKRPSNKTLRLNRAEKGPRMFEADEVRKLLGAAPLPLRAMILLGVNCGFGNSDVGTLPRSALDLDRGWVNYHRPKTGITRRCPLWPETVAALRVALTERPEPRDEAHAGLVFVTKFGLPWAKDVADSPVTKEMRKLLDALGIGGHRSFYALRHTFETIGGEAKDQVAVDAIMGHIRDDMASVYRERISDDRLKAVSDHVRTWVFGEEEIVKEKRKRKG
jgi:integrase